VLNHALQPMKGFLSYFTLTKVTEERLVELFCQRSISGQPQAPKAAKFSTLPSYGAFIHPSTERYPDAAAKIHLNHLLLDPSRRPK